MQLFVPLYPDIRFFFSPMPYNHSTSSFPSRSIIRKKVCFRKFADNTALQLRFSVLRHSCTKISDAPRDLIQ